MFGDRRDSASAASVPDAKGVGTHTAAHPQPSAVVDAIGTALLLLDVGQLLDPVGLRALACCLAAFRLGVVELGLGGFGGPRLGRSDFCLLLALDCLGCFVALSRRFVGLILGGNGALLGRLVSRAFALLGFGARLTARRLVASRASLISVTT